MSTFVLLLELTATSVHQMRRICTDNYPTSVAGIVVRQTFMPAANLVEHGAWQTPTILQAHGLVWTGLFTHDATLRCVELAMGHMFWLPGPPKSRTTAASFYTRQAVHTFSGVPNCNLCKQACRGSIEPMKKSVII